jgi:hypothetical protein
MGVSKQEQILTSQNYLSEYKNFEKAVRFADQQLKTVLLQYEEKVKELVDEKNYKNLKAKTENANTVSGWHVLAEKFNELSIKDSNSLAKKCEMKSSLLDKKIQLEKSISEYEKNKKTVTENRDKKNKCKFRVFKYCLSGNHVSLTLGNIIFYGALILSVLVMFVYSWDLESLFDDTSFWGLLVFTSPFI